MANDRTTWREAFKMADQVLYMGVRGVTDLMMAPGLVNLDFADIRTVMAAMGKAMMGTGEAEGENRAIRAAEAAINNPLLEDTSMSGARGLLINITGGDDMTLFEVDQAANRVREEVDENADIIFGSAIDEGLAGRIRVSVVATGIDTPMKAEAQRPQLVAVGGSAMAAASPLPTAAPGVSLAGAMLPPVSTPNPFILRPSVPNTTAMPLAEAAVEHAMSRSAAVALAPAVPPATAPRPRSGLFAEAPPAAEPTPLPQAADAARSLFGTVTGVFRRRTSGGIEAAPGQPVRVEPVVSQDAAPRPTVRASRGRRWASRSPPFCGDSPLECCNISGLQGNMWK